MEMLRLLDELEEMADRGEKWYCRVPPLIGKTVLDAADLFDLIHQMRASLPKEMTEATQVTRDRDRIVQEAHEQRTKILEAAREQAQLMVSSDELVKQAEASAAEIRRQAEVEAESIKADAETWVRGIVERLENYTNRMQATVQKTKKMLSSQTGPGSEQEELLPEDEE